MEYYALLENEKIIRIKSFNYFPGIGEFNANTHSRENYIVIPLNDKDLSHYSVGDYYSQE